MKKYTTGNVFFKSPEEMSDEAEEKKILGSVFWS